MLLRDLAQFGSAPALGAGGRGFESLNPDHFFGASPSGKAAVFGTAMRWFESSRPSQF